MMLSDEEQEWRRKMSVTHGFSVGWPGSLVIFAVAIMALAMMGLAWGSDGLGWSLIVVCGVGGAAHWLIVREISQQREDTYRRSVHLDSSPRRTTT